MNVNNLALFHCLSEYGCDAHGHRTTHIPNVAAYAGRGLVIPARLAFMPLAPGVEEAGAYYRRLGIGPKEICLYPPAGSLFEGVRASACASERARQHAGEGGEAELYIPGPEGWRFLTEMGFLPTSICNQPLALRSLTDKVGLRRLSSRLGLARLFPHHAFSRTKEEIGCEARRLFHAGCDRVVVKHPDLASGEGQIVVQSMDDFDLAKSVDFFSTYVTGEIEFVVEEWWAGEDFSIVYLADGNGWRMRFLSGQFMAAADGRTHLGNCVCSEPEAVLDHHMHNRTERVIALQSDIDPMIHYLWRHGYRGSICFDGKWRKSGRYKLFEANPRPSASIFPWFVLQQAQRPGEQIASSMLAVALTSPLTISQALDVFGRDAYCATARRGVIIGNAIGMVDPTHPKLTIITVADTVLASVRQALQIKRRFEGARFHEVIVPRHLHSALAV